MCYRITPLRRTIQQYAVVTPSLTSKHENRESSLLPLHVVIDFNDKSFQLNGHAYIMRSVGD